MSGVVIFGYYGQGNLGDETNLRHLVDLIRKIDYSLPITIITAQPEETADRLQLKTIEKFDFIAMVLAFREADLLIGGGGSLFQDRTSLRSLLYYCALVLLAKLNQMKVFLYGQGVGPIRSWFGKRVAGLILSTVDLITIRDRLSIISLAELNVRKPEVHFTAEPLLLAEPAGQDRIIAFWNRFETSKPLRLGLIIFENDTLRTNFWNQILDCLNWAQRVELYFLPTTKSDSDSLQRFGLNFNITILPTESSWEQLQAAIGGLDLVVSMRLHGLVAAVVQGIPCYGLGIDPKIEGFCLQIGVPFQFITSETDCVTLCNRILGYLYQPLAERKPWQTQLRIWKARAVENQIILQQFIKKRL